MTMHPDQHVVIGRAEFPVCYDTIKGQRDAARAEAASIQEQNIGLLIENRRLRDRQIGGWMVLGAALIAGAIIGAVAVPLAAILVGSV
jgi:hypothetical protein